MRTDTATFHSANSASQKSPRFVVAIIFPVASIYITSHTGIASVPGTVLDGCLQEPSAISQHIIPDEGRSEIGSMSFSLVDVDSQFTDAVRDQLGDGEGLRGKEARLYVGYEGMDFSAFQLFQTQVVSGVEYDEGTYKVQCRDITREQRKEIFEPKKTTLRDTVTAAATTIPVYVTADFETVFHGPSYSDAPSATVGYIKIDDEIIRYTGKTADTFTGCTRGVLNTRAVEHAVDAATTADRRVKVDEYIYLELPAAKMAYAILTGVLHGDAATLPDHWHLGIATTWVRLSDFTGIGTDLWNTSLDTAGFVARFTQLTKTDGKKFLESELYMLLGCYSPVYSDGTIGLKRMNHVLADAPFVVELNENNCVEWSSLRHELDLLHNHLRVDWNWNGSDFTRRNDFIDADSVAIHGAAPIKELKFKGLHGARHTDAIVRTRLDALRDRYSYPPESISVTVLPSLNRLEVGDILRVNLPTVRDFVGAGANINRSFEIQQMRLDFATGNVVCDLFGSTGRASVDAPSDDASPLPDAYYTAQGVNINTVATVNVVGDVGVIQPGTYNLAGNADMNASGAVYYYPGDLELADGATLTINNNVQIRVMGFFTINGDIDGVGRGKAGVADSASFDTTQAGTPGYIGNSRGRDGIKFKGGRLATIQTVPCAFTQGQNTAFPFLELSVSGSTLLGIPTDLRGTSGGGGGKLQTLDAGGGSPIVRSVGGTGADSGAGLCIVCRGLSIGASGSIDLSGDDAAATSTVAVFTALMYPGPGGAGSPGGFLLLLDGAGISIPDLSGGGFIAACGTVPDNGTPLPERGPTSAVDQTAWNPPLAGFRDESIISGVDLSTVAHRIQYVPESQTPEEDEDAPPPAPAVLFVLAAVESVRLQIGGVDIDSVDVVQFYASVTNDRTSALLIAEGKFGDTVYPIFDNQVRYYWARTGRRTARGVVYSGWCPEDPNDGATNSPLRGNFFCSDPEFSRASDDTHWYVNDGMSISPTGGTYGGYMTLDFGATPSGDRVLVPRTDLLSINAGQCVSARVRLRRTSTITPVVKNCVLEVTSFDEPYWPTAPLSAVEVQHTIIPNLQSLPLDTWQDFTVTVPTAQFGYPFARLRLVFNVGTGGTGTIDVDYFQAQLDAPVFGAATAGLVPKATAASLGQQKLRDDGTWVHDHPATAAEVLFGSTPLNYGYAPGDARRWGVQGASSEAAMNSIGDQTALVQSAINETQRENSNAELVLPAGYILCGPLTITKGCKIRGTKGTNNYIGTTLWYNGGATDDFVVFDSSTGTGPCGVQHVYLYIGSGDATTGTALKYISDGGTQRPSEFVIHDVLIDPAGTFGRGLEIDGSASTTSGSTGIRDIRIDKLRVSGCSIAGESVLLHWATHLTATMLHVNQGSGSAAGIKVTGTNFNLNLTALECEGALDIGGTTDRVTLGGFVTGGLAIGASVTKVAGCLLVGGNFSVASGATGFVNAHISGSVSNSSNAFHISNSGDSSGQLTVSNQFGFRVKQIAAGSGARLDLRGVANTYNRVAYSDASGAGSAYFALRDDNAGADRLYIDADGTVQILGSNLQIAGTSGPRIIIGTGSPEGVVTSGVGSLFLRSNGGAGTTLYVKESGTGNTGWVAK